jgi:hypothetical protein
VRSVRLRGRCAGRNVSDGGLGQKNGGLGLTAAFVRGRQVLHDAAAKPILKRSQPMANVAVLASANLLFRSEQRVMRSVIVKER